MGPDQLEYRQKHWEAHSSHLEPNNFALTVYTHIQKNPCTNLKLLDIGSGNGRDALFFAEKGILVTALDFSDKSLTQLQHLYQARQYLKIKIICQDIATMNLEAESFDIIYAHYSLHYFNHEITKKVFQTIYKALKSTGIFAVCVKSTKDKRYGEGIEIAPNIYNYQGHIRHFFDIPTLKELLYEYATVNIEENMVPYGSYMSSNIEAIAHKYSTSNLYRD